MSHKKTVTTKSKLGFLPQVAKGHQIRVLDASACIYDPDILSESQGIHFIIPTTTVSILSRVSQSLKDTGKKFAAEKFLQNFNDIIEGKSVKDKINFTNRNSLQLLYPNGDLDRTKKAEYSFPDGDEKNSILDTCMLVKEMGHTKVSLCTTDILIKTKASYLGIEIYKGHEVSLKGFQSPKVLHFKSGTRNDDVLKSLKEFEPKLFNETGPFNQGEYYLAERSEGRFFILRYTKNGFKHIYPKTKVFGIGPKNIEQSLALTVLVDPDIDIVAITGASGSGKTILSLAAGLEGYRERFSEIGMSKAIIEVGNPLGFLPGDLQEKINPHIQNFTDNITFIKNEIRKASDKNELEKVITRAEKETDGRKGLFFEAIQMLRGRTFARRFYIIDECQNLTPHEIKTIITRAGEGTKVILLGDINQIDSPYLDKNTNGLTHAVEKFRGQSIFAHVHLATTERSRLAALADKLL